jgi:hypothetical protein
MDQTDQEQAGEAAAELEKLRLARGAEAGAAGNDDDDDGDDDEGEGGGGGGGEAGDAAAATKKKKKKKKKKKGGGGGGSGAAGSGAAGQTVGALFAHLQTHPPRRCHSMGSISTCLTLSISSTTVSLHGLDLYLPLPVHPSITYPIIQIVFYIHRDRTSTVGPLSAVYSPTTSQTMNFELRGT